MLSVKVTRKQFIKIPEKLEGPSGVKIGFASQEMAKRALYNEFGTRGSGKGFSTPRGGGFGGPIPERPFMRNTIRNNRLRYIDALRSSAVKLVEGKTTLKVVFAKFGTLIQGDVQKEITSLQSPPNSPLTIKLKGSSNPLIDTGEMRASVTYELIP